MRKLNSILTYIFLGSMLVTTVAFIIAACIVKPSALLGDLLGYYILTMLCAIVGLLLNPEVDYYEGYIPEPDRSQEYEKIQRELYESGHDMSKPNL